MRKELIISTIPQETRVAVLEDDELVEFLIERHRAQGIAGNIYKGRVTKVLPGMQSAFVDIGLDRDAFLYVSDFFEDTDEYDRIVSSAEDEALKDGDSPRRSSPGRSTRAPRSEKSPTREKPEEPPRERTSAEKEEPTVVAPEAAAETESPSREPENRSPRRRPERRERKPRVSTFESRPDESGYGGLAPLPGESLAKYRAQPAARTGSVEEKAEQKQKLDQTIDETPDQHILEEDPREARTAPADQEAPLEEDAHEAASETPETSQEAVGGDAVTEPAPSQAPEGSSEVGNDAGDEGSTEDSDDDESGEEGKQKARISDRPKNGLFSRKPPVRRPRRRAPAKTESGRSDSSRPPTISDLLKAGQEIVVQVSKEPLGKKGARITSHIALPGRYLVYMPTVDHVGVSRKIASEDERARLRKIISENREGLPGGFIVRTAAEGRDEKEFIQDLRFLADLWGELREKSDKSSAPALIHSDLNLVQRVLRDQLSEEFKAIRLDNEVEYAKVLEFVSRFQPSLVNRVRLHLRENAIFEEHGLQQEIDKAMRSKVWLKSGGYIVVNQTEALVAIDVNTGKFVGKSNRLEDTIVRTNLDAVHEIVRQVRLRNLGGIIVVDFIDMEERKSRQRVMQALEEELRKDRSPSKILQFNDFGLVAITRKRTQPSLERIMGTSCPRCGGAGFVKAVETVCYEIQQEVKKMLGQTEGDELTLRVSPDVAKALKSGEFVDFTEVEEESKKDIRIQGDPALVAERFDIY